MGFSTNERGEVVLTMSADDWQILLMALGYAAGAANRDGNMASFRNWIGLADRLNEGNPHYTPYGIEEEEGKQ